MSRLRTIGLLALVFGALGLPGSASAAIDGTTTAVDCTPSTPTTGTATTCTATVSDDVDGSTVDTGVVQFSSSPASGAFSEGDACSLSATTPCSVTFTPSAGGDYTIQAAYQGDGGSHALSTGTSSVTAIDPTTTSFRCTPATVQINSSTSCTATLSDSFSPGAPHGQVQFSATPSAGAYGTPGICQWTPSGGGGSATCTVTFTPTAAAQYTLKADYSGDEDHAESSGTFSLTATSTPANGGPGSQPGSGSVSVPVTPGPPPPGTLTVAATAKVSRKHVAALPLSCAGQTGSRCVGTLFLSTTIKVKVKVKVPVTVKVKVGKGKHRHTVTKTKTKTKLQTEKKTIVVGSASFNLGAAGTTKLSIKLSKPALKVLTKARHGRLKVHALVPGANPRNVTLIAPKQKKHKKHHKQHKGHGKHKK
jgi:hypothetical protein